MRRSERGEDEMDLSRWARQEKDDDAWETRMLSIGAKIKQVAGLSGTSAVDPRTANFIDRMVIASENGARTSHLSEAQVEWIEDIHAKHFGGAQG